MKISPASELELEKTAAVCAHCWRDAGIAPLITGLRGGLGAGKTTWVRALLRSLGHGDRVPSPTYTLLELYEVGGLAVVHLDLYRLNEPGELEFLGLRDWMALDNLWLFAEWPERGGTWVEHCDLLVDIEFGTGERREMVFTAQTMRGQEALGILAKEDFRLAS